MANTDRNPSQKNMQEKSKSNSSSDTPIWKRLLATAALLILLGTLVVLVITLAGSGDSGTILACLFVLMVVPCICYLFQLLRRLHNRRRDPGR